MKEEIRRKVWKYLAGPGFQPGYQKNTSNRGIGRYINERSLSNEGWSGERNEGNENKEVNRGWCYNQNWRNWVEKVDTICEQNIFGITENKLKNDPNELSALLLSSKPFAHCEEVGVSGL